MVRVGATFLRSPESSSNSKAWTGLKKSSTACSEVIGVLSVMVSVSVTVSSSTRVVFLSWYFVESKSDAR